MHSLSELNLSLFLFEGYWPKMALSWKKGAPNFFNCYLTSPQPTLGHSQGGILTNPMLITTFVEFWSEEHQEPQSEVGSSPSEHLMAFELGTFWFYLQHINPLSHSLSLGVVTNPPGHSHHPLYDPFSKCFVSK